MHVAEFTLYNSYIPSSYRQIILDYYAVDKTNNILPTSTDNNNSTNDKFDLKFNYLINDDINFSMSSQYGNISNMAGLEFMGQISGLARKGASVIKDNKNLDNINSLMNYSIWQKTEPLSTNLTIILYAKTDPLIDVVIPAYVLMSHCIIDFMPSNSGDVYSFPGLTAFEAINIAKIKDGIEFKQDPPKKDAKTSPPPTFDGKFTSKLLSLYIKGLLNIDLAMIKNITPTFSKHTAKSNYDKIKYTGDYPISAELTLQIESIIPADSSMLWAGALNPLKDKNKSIYVMKTDTSALGQVENSEDPAPAPASKTSSPPKNPKKTKVRKANPSAAKK